jgi:PTH1 family peptidyl-tRNA hydrolase
MVLDRLAKRWKCRFQKEPHLCRLAITAVDGDDLMLMKPMTFMNRSGLAVDALLRNHSVDPNKILVLCDDLSLPLGKLRLRKKGSDGGHNGLASILRSLGTEAVPRLRFGIKGEGIVETVDYVLSPFHRLERPKLKSMIERGEKAVVAFLERGVDVAMNVVNRSFQEGSV